MNKVDVTTPRMEMGLAGRFKIEAVNEETGERRVLADWFPNLILDQGLNRIGTNAGDPSANYPKFLTTVYVGSGSTAPAVTDTSLQTFVAASTTIQSSSDTFTSGPPAYSSAFVTYRFATGVAAGNLSEVGVGWGGLSGLFSRSLIKDGSGNPTTITVLSTEALDITYEFRVYPPGDATGSITISGTSYSYTIRPQQISSPNYWTAAMWSVYGPLPGQALGTYDWAYDGAIGSATSAPSGNRYSSSMIFPSKAAYSNNSYKLGCTIVYNLNDANFGSGIQSVSVPFYSSCTWQVGFSPSIPKTNTKVLTLSFEVSWARRP